MDYLLKNQIHICKSYWEAYGPYRSTEYRFPTINNSENKNKHNSIINDLTVIFNSFLQKEFFFNLIFFIKANVVSSSSHRVIPNRIMYKKEKYIEMA